MRDAKSIFLQAVEHYPVEKWDAYLDGACGENGALREKVRKLLDAHASSDSFIDQKTQTVAQAPLEQEGTQIGRFKLLQRIGDGGFGVVYMASQTSPIKRNVAIKIIKPGMDTKEVIARFEAERQALAVMDHPNIARIFDGGTTASGRPYFAMELVKGVNITEYCDQNNLKTSDRLKLFTQICLAVQHAHQKGVIHRDLKPSNVLVTLHDGEPVPKVIDFGIAKALNHQLTEKTLFTQYGQMIGTPQYMSPEQAELSGLDVDTRSDIYSLGVLLYELLTGKPPFEAEELRKAGFDEMRRVIREQEPLRPSHQLRTLANDTATTVAKLRSERPASLQRIVRGDLDWIVMKALEKNRNRRYETANGLANDVSRYLSSEPTMARPPSNWYRLQRFAMRNRALVSSGAAIILCVVLSFAAILYQSSAARNAEQDALRARDQATAAAKRADAEKLRATAFSRAFTEIVTPVDPNNRSNNTDLKTILNRLALSEFPGAQDSPSLMLEFLLNLGISYRGVGEEERAREFIDRAFEIYESEQFDSSDLVTRLYLQRGMQNDSLRDLKQALVHAEKAGLENDTKALVLGYLCRFVGSRWSPHFDPELGEKYGRQSLEILKHLNRPASPSLTGACRSWLGYCLIYQGKINEGIELQLKSLKDYASVPGHELSLMHSNVILGIGYSSINDFSKLRSVANRAIELSRLTKDPHGEATGMSLLAECNLKENRFKEAIAHYEHSAKKYLPKNPLGYGWATLESALMCESLGDLEQAREHYLPFLNDEDLGMYTIVARTRVGLNPSSRESDDAKRWEVVLTENLENQDRSPMTPYSRTAVRADLIEFELNLSPSNEKCLELVKLAKEAKTYSPRDSLGNCFHACAQALEAKIYVRMQEFDKSEAAITELLKVIPQVHSSWPLIHLQSVMREMTDMLVDKPAGRERLLRIHDQVLTHYKQILGSRHSQIAFTQMAIAELLLKEHEDSQEASDLKQALRLVEAAFEILNGHEITPRRFAVEARDLAAELCRRLGNSESSIAWQERTVE